MNKRIIERLKNYISLIDFIKDDYNDPDNAFWTEKLKAQILIEELEEIELKK